jgi:hypothetical protein
VAAPTPVAAGTRRPQIGQLVGSTGRDRGQVVYISGRLPASPASRAISSEDPPPDRLRSGVGARMSDRHPRQDSVVTTGRTESAPDRIRTCDLRFRRGGVSSVGLVWDRDSALYRYTSSSEFVWTPSRLLPFCCPHRGRRAVSRSCCSPPLAAVLLCMESSVCTQEAGKGSPSALVQRLKSRAARSRSRRSVQTVDDPSSCRGHARWRRMERDRAGREGAPLPAGDPWVDAGTGRMRSARAVQV